MEEAVNRCDSVKSGFVDYESLMSKSAKRIVTPVLRVLQQNQMDTTNICMGGGSPDPATFPIAELQFKLKDGTVLQVDPDTLAASLQYGLSGGMEELVDLLTEFQRKVHNPPSLRENHPGQMKLILTHGAKEALALVFSTLLNEGMWALSEDVTYPSALDMLPLVGAHFHGIKIDEDGMVVEDLVRVLDSWDTLHPGVEKPRLMYVMTSCENPTGVIWSMERKRGVYEVARKHDLIIIEDDAYYFLQFKRPLIQSLFSLDEDGRVIRVDTFSKIVSAGMRIGWISGPAPILERIVLRKDNSSGFPSGLTQGILLQLLKHWGPEGLLQQGDRAMNFYKHKAETALKYVRKYLTGLVEWYEPSGGLFLWVRVLGVKDSKVICQKALDRKLVVVYGGYFQVSQGPNPYLRVSYALASEEECELAMKLLGEIIREVQGTTIVE